MDGTSFWNIYNTFFLSNCRHFSMFLLYLVVYTSPINESHILRIVPPIFKYLQIRRFSADITCEMWFEYFVCNYLSITVQDWIFFFNSVFRAMGLYKMSIILIEFSCFDETLCLTLSVFFNNFSFDQLLRHFHALLCCFVLNGLNYPQSSFLSKNHVSIYWLKMLTGHCSIYSVRYAYR